MHTLLLKSSLIACFSLLALQTALQNVLHDAAGGR